MVHSQQVHKTEPEPLTNTLPGRDTFDIEIFGMEGVPVNAMAEWKARKEQEAGVAALAAASMAKRPRHAYTVIPEADLMAALQQHKHLMATRKNQPLHSAVGMTPASAYPPNGVPPFPPPPGYVNTKRARVYADKARFPGMPPPTLPPGAPPPFAGALVPPKPL